MGQRGGEWPRSADTRTVIRQIQAALPTKKSGLSRRIFRRKSFASRSTVCLNGKTQFFSSSCFGFDKCWLNLLQLAADQCHRQREKREGDVCYGELGGQLGAASAVEKFQSLPWRTSHWWKDTMLVLQVFSLHTHTSQNLPLGVHSNF